MSGNSVLIVEESSVLSDLMRDLLEATGFTVVQASTSRDGLALFEERPFAVVLVDEDMQGLTAGELVETMRGHSEGSTPVLLITGAQPVEAELPAGLTALQCLRKPIDPVELITRVRAAAGRDPGVLIAAAPQSAPVPVPAIEPQVMVSRTPGQGKVITVFSLKGGVGTSTIAVNLAVCLRRLSNDATALVDLCLESGALNILLDILPTSTLDELIAVNGNMTAEVVTQYMVGHKSGVSLLSAPPSPERAELIDGAGLRKVMGFLREQFDYVVVDTASTFAEHTLMALEMADHIILPFVGDISSVRATTTALDIFQALNIPEGRVVLVFNEVFPKMGLSRKHAETSMNVTVLELPFGGAKLIDSINLGTPICVSTPDNPFAVAIDELAREVSYGDGPVQRRDKPADLFSRMKKRLTA